MEIDPRLFEEDQTLVPSVEQRKKSSFGDFPLKVGGSLPEIEIAYETWGTLQNDRSNAILICHALSGDSHAVGWWDRIVGPDKVIDTNKYYVVCSNVLGGCQGSTGPTSKKNNGDVYGSDFPQITVEDMVLAQSKLADELGIECWFAVCGGSMGGMQALEWACQFPERVKKVWMTASCYRHSAMQIAFNEIGRQAILRDMDFVQNGTSFHGLAVARMIGHLSYLSHKSFDSKFGRTLQSKDHFSFDMGIEFSVESYLNYQGEKFTKRFDPYSYLLLTKAIDYYEADTSKLKNSQFLLTSFTSDFLYLPEQSTELFEILTTQGISVEKFVFDLPFGHDSFLLDSVYQVSALHKFLNIS